MAELNSNKLLTVAGAATGLALMTSHTVFPFHPLGGTVIVGLYIWAVQMAKPLVEWSAITRLHETAVLLRQMTTPTDPDERCETVHQLRR